MIGELFPFYYFQGPPVGAIILEAPFTNMWVASISYPLLKVSDSFSQDVKV